MWIKSFILLPVILLLSTAGAIAKSDINYELKDYKLGTEYIFDDTKRNDLSPHGEYVFTGYFKKLFPKVERITEIVENNKFKGYQLHQSLDSQSNITINILRIKKNTFSIGQVTLLKTIEPNFHVPALLTKLKHKYGENKNILASNLNNLGLSVADTQLTTNVGRWGNIRDKAGSSVTAVVIGRGTTDQSPILLVQAKSITIKEKNLKYLQETNDFVDTDETKKYEF